VVAVARKATGNWGVRVCIAVLNMPYLHTLCHMHISYVPDEFESLPVPPLLIEYNIYSILSLCVRDFDE
jgi:hypothetical protein